MPNLEPVPLLAGATHAPRLASSVKAGCSIAITTQQISNYHAARYRAAGSAFEKVTVISAMNDADFTEFLAPLQSCNAIRLFAGKSRYIDAVANGEIWAQVHAALGDTRPDVTVVAGWSFPESLATIAWARKCGARVVMMSESQVSDGPRHRLREAIKARVVKACDAALVGGARQHEYIVELGMARENVFVGYNAVDNRHFAEGAAEARVDATRLRQEHALPERFLLASGRFIPKKNFNRLIEAFALAVKQTGSPHSLILLGDGETRDEIEQTIRQNGVQSRVLMPGYKAYNIIPLYYGLAEAFVHVPLTEQWGLVINEAAAAGLPLVVSCTCGAAAELVVSGGNGFLVDPLSVHDISGTLASVMLASAERLQAMGSNSERIVANWGPERFAAGLRDAAAAALDCKPRRLGTFDAALLRLLSRRYFSAVS